MQDISVMSSAVFSVSRSQTAVPSIGAAKLQETALKCNILWSVMCCSNYGDLKPSQNLWARKKCHVPNLCSINERDPTWLCLKALVSLYLCNVNTNKSSPEMWRRILLSYGSEQSRHLEVSFCFTAGIQRHELTVNLNISGSDNTSTLGLMEMWSGTFGPHSIII